jgi:hypothetical protein
MARSTGVALTGQGRRAVPVSRGKAREARRTITLGELIAAAYDVVGPDSRRVVRVLSSPEMRRGTGRRIVVG